MIDAGKSRLFDPALARADAAGQRGWCPSAHRPMAAADGDLLRIRVPRARLTPAALHALAAVSRRWADGGVLLTRRAKLELRGIGDSRAAMAALQAVGLTTDDPRLPDRIVSPATDLDDRACDIRATLDRVDAALAAEPCCSKLPDKFVLAIDGGGRAHVAGVSADLRFDACKTAGGPLCWRISMGGTLGDAALLGWVADRDLPEVTCSLLRRYVAAVDGRAAPVPRMRALLREQELQPFVDTVADRLIDAPERLPAARPAFEVGYQRNLGYAAGFVFGRIEADGLEALAEVGQGDIRLLPNRCVIVPGGDAGIGRRLRSIGAVDRGDDARLGVAACVGQGGCARATTATRDDALELSKIAPNLCRAGSDIGVHVSGCAKGCARRAAAPVTLVGGNGCYDIVLSGGPLDAPRWRGLAFGAVRPRLAALDRCVTAMRRPEEGAAAAIQRLGGDRLYHLIEAEIAGV